MGFIDSCFDFIADRILLIVGVIVILALAAAVVMLYLKMKDYRMKYQYYKRLSQQAARQGISENNENGCVETLCRLYQMLEIDGYSVRTVKPTQIDTNKMFAAVETLKNIKAQYINICNARPSSDKADNPQKKVAKKGDAKTARTLYASFPRSAGSLVYFSDVSEKLCEESHFELNVSADGTKATFRPMDFMKIRNVDEAMNGIVTEGVRANLAQLVTSVVAGKAHRENKDWIIDEQAIVKLA